MTRRALVWMGLGGPIALGAFVLVALAGPGEAFAQDSSAPPAEEPPEPGSGTPRDLAPDWRRGTIFLSLGAAYEAPFGQNAKGFVARDLVTGGPAFQGALGFGLSRYLSIELKGSYGKLSVGDECSACKGDTISGGLGFVYHVAQGIAFDPWGSFGVGFRMANLTVPEGSATAILAGAGSYQGIDFARLALGGEFYPTANLGFGPYIEANVGSYRVRPSGLGIPSVYAFLSIGFRVTFDPLRSSKVAAGTAAISRPITSF